MQNDAPVEFSCPACGAILRAPRSKQGRKSPCPKCNAMVEVPSADAAAAEADLREGYAIAGLDTRPTGALPMGLSDEDAGAGQQFKRPVIAYSERPKLPPHPMINGVFTFLLQSGTIVWACGLAIGAAVLLSLLGMAVAAGMASSGGGIASAMPWISSMLLTGVFFSAALVWVVVASAFLLCILQDSAAGNARIENWPDVVWLDWIGESLYLIASTVGSAAIGFGVAWLCDGARGPLMMVFIPLGVYLFFPVMLLSALEMQSPLLPISPMILRSMVTSWKTWIVFYLETSLLGILLVAALMLTIVLARLAPPESDHAYILLLALCAMGALMVVAQLIYFRLLGRLAWVCAEDLRALQAEEEEEDEGDEEDESPPDIRPTPIDDF